MLSEDIENDALDAVTDPANDAALLALFRGPPGTWVDVVKIRRDLRIPPGRLVVCWAQPTPDFVEPGCDDYVSVILAEPTGGTARVIVNLTALEARVAAGRTSY